MNLLEADHFFRIFRSFCLSIKEVIRLACEFNLKCISCYLNHKLEEEIKTLITWTSETSTAP